MIETPPSLFNPTSTATHSIRHYHQKADDYVRFLRLFGLKVDHQTKLNWGELISLARSIDNYLDCPSDIEIETREAMVIDYLQTALGEPYVNLAQLQGTRLGRLTALTQRIFNLNREFKSALDLTEFRVARVEEGRSYAEMFAVAAEPETTRQPQFDRFMEVFTKVGAATNLLNSAIGLREDSVKGEVSINPSIGTRLVLLSETVSELVKPMTLA